MHQLAWFHYNANFTAVYFSLGCVCISGWILFGLFFNTFIYCEVIVDTNLWFGSHGFDPLLMVAEIMPLSNALTPTCYRLNVFMDWLMYVTWAMYMQIW